MAGFGLDIGQCLHMARLGHVGGLKSKLKSNWN